MSTTLETLARRLSFKSERASKLKESIEQRTGVSDLRAKCRKPINAYARMIFAHHCRQGGMTYQEIGKELERDHSTAHYLAKKYKENKVYDKTFKELAERVELEL